MSAPNAAPLPSFGTFEELCGPQLAGSGVPYELWGILFDKLRHDVFDAGESFQLATIETSSEDGDASETEDASAAATDERTHQGQGPAVLTTLRSMKALEDVWVLDHAWTFRVRDARKTLTDNAALCQRLGTMLLGDPDAPVSAVYTVMWHKASTYRIATEASLDEECCWYLMDEVGSAIRHVLSEADGNCRCVPLFYTPGNIAVSILWMTKDTDAGDIASFSNWRERSQCPGVHALLHGLEFDEDVDGVKQQLMAASNMVLEEADAMWASSKQRLRAERTDTGAVVRVLAPTSAAQPVLVASDLPELVDNLRSIPEASGRYDFTPNVADADIVWLAEYQTDGMRSEAFAGASFVSQLGIEAVLCHKERLQRALRRTYGNPEWLPRTYDASTEMHLFAGDYLSRAARGDNNLWIVKPHCMARSMDMVVTDCLPLLLRQSETGPKIICKYLENPCLFRGRKFDLRLIVAVQRLRPTRRVYMYRRVWPRFALEPYGLSDFDTYEKHWTVMNYANPDKMINLLNDAFVAEFDATHGAGSWDRTMTGIQRMTLDVFDAVAQDPEVPYNANGAAIYGLDVMLTESLSPVLLEATFAPDCHRACVQYPTFFGDVFSTLFEDDPKNFEPLFDDASSRPCAERQLIVPRSHKKK